MEAVEARLFDGDEKDCSWWLSFDVFTGGKFFVPIVALLILLCHGFLFDFTRSYSRFYGTVKVFTGCTFVNTEDSWVRILWLFNG